MNGNKRVDQLQPGDIVEICWLDTQGHDRQTVDELRKLQDLLTTNSYGVFIKRMKTCIVICHETGDPDSDNWYAEQLPYGMITSIRVLGHTKLNFGEDP
jgi:hypothetical protein